MSSAAMLRPKERPALLNNLVLGVHATRTADDTAAERMLRELIEEFSPGTPLEFMRAKDIDPPWLAVGGSLFRGIERIKAFTKLVRETAG